MRSEELIISGNPEDIEEGIEDIREADELLKEHDAAGILIGGKAFAFIAGAHPVEIENRKDVDVLVIQGGEDLSHETNHDFFLPDETGAHRNRNDFTLPYHIHYLGEPLEPGIYLPPPEVILLTESEMATRRAVDRLIPDIIEHNFKVSASSFEVLPLNEIVIEFPGDLSWLGKHLPNVPIQIISREKEGLGRRTFISFKPRLESALPKTAFPTSKDVRVPECDVLGIFPEIKLEPEEVKKMGLQLIKHGFVKEGVAYILEREPAQADGFILLRALLHRDNIENYPLQTAEALAMWLKTAEEKAFIAPLFLSAKLEGFFSLEPDSDIQNGFNESCRDLSKEIGKKYGPRFQQLSERLLKLDAAEFVRDDSETYWEKLKPYLREILMETMSILHRRENEFSCFRGNTVFSGKFEDFIRPAGSKVILFKWSHCFQDDPEKGRVGELFTEQGKDWISRLDITDEEIEGVFTDPKYAEGVIRSAISNPELLQRRFWSQKAVNRKRENTPGKMLKKGIRQAKKTGKLDLIEVLIDKFHKDPVVYTPSQIREQVYRDFGWRKPGGIMSPDDTEEVNAAIEQKLSQQQERIKNASEIIPELLGYKSMEELASAIKMHIGEKGIGENRTPDDIDEVCSKLSIYFGERYFSQR